jgi:Ca2+-binding RTX toxin-like protein
MVKLWADFATGSNIDFDPVNDEFNINDGALSAADFIVTSPTPTTTEFAVPGKSVTLKTSIDKLTSANITFLDGSLLKIGDDRPHAAGDTLDNTLVGAGFDDQLIGLAGDDKLNGRAGDDNMVGGAGNDTYTVDSEFDSVSEDADAGTDLVLSKADSYTLGDNVENVVLSIHALPRPRWYHVDATGNDLANTMEGNQFDNRLSGLAGSDILDGGEGNDVLIGGSDADTMAGGPGNDRYFVDNGNDSITESFGEGEDSVHAFVSYTLGDDDVEQLYLVNSLDIDGTGNASDNSIIGSLGANHLYGMGGRDFIVGNGAGVGQFDVMYGGPGDDTFVARSGDDVVVEDADEGTELVKVYVSYTLGPNVENLHLLERGVGIEGIGNELANSIEGNSRHNHVYGMRGKDILDGRGGDDYLDGGAGRDTLIGRAGNDIYIATAGDKIIDSGDGIDTVESAVTWTLGPKLENLTLTGSSDVNGYGNSLANFLTGNGGVNRLAGLDGDDTIVFGNSDAIDGGTGTDTLLVDISSIDLTGLAGDEIIGIEQILNFGSSSMSLTLSAADVIALSDSDTVRVTGANGDSVHASGEWLQGDDVDGYHTWTSGGATLVIDADIAFLAS